MKTAIIIGATGVTGAPLTQYLLNSDDYQYVIVFSRRELGFTHEKLTTHLVNFDQPLRWCHLIQGDDLFSAMGTTKKQAGSEDAQYRVDYTYQANTLQHAAKNGVERLFLVSSPGANAQSRFFYPRLKGELDTFALQQRFGTHVLFKPSLIVGDRRDNRLGEKIATAVLTPLCHLIPPLARYRPIKGEQLARAIAHCAKTLSETGIHTLELDAIFTCLPE